MCIMPYEGKHRSAGRPGRMTRTYRRGKPGNWVSTTRGASDVCIYPAGGGGPRSKGATLRHYQRQQKRGGFWYSLRYCEAIQQLARCGPVAWFQWVFLRLEEHEETCRWRRLVTRGASFG